MSPSKNYIPTLDGWRCLSILAVIAFHLPRFAVGGRSIATLQSRGVLGVEVFFVLSGFLICTRLMREEQQFGSISLPVFYTRRLFRIQPAAFAYLLTILILRSLHMIQVGFWAWIAALLAWRNYYPKSLWEAPRAVYTNHFWSLAVEEHFYLIIPALLVFVPQRWRVRSLAFLYGLSFVWGRLSTHWKLTDNRTDVSWELLMLPSLLAIVLFENKGLRDRVTGRKVLALWLTLVATLVLSFLCLHGAASMPLIHLLIVCSVFGTALYPSSVVGRFLELAPLRFVGRISFSLYLWQQLFCIEPTLASASRGLAAFQRTPVNLLAALLCAVLSYFLIERPMIRLGHKLAPVLRP